MEGEPMTSSLALMALLGGSYADDTAKPANAFVTALEFVHEFGKADLLAPAKDRSLKAALGTAGLPGKPLTFDAVKEHLDLANLAARIGDNAIPDTARMHQLLAAAAPASRAAMFDKPRQHLALLSTQFDQIDAGHHESNKLFVEWIAKNHSADKPLHVIAICTGNTRRSMLSATMGNLAASYHGLNVKFFSGGTAPDAFNSRTVATLKEIGVELTATGKEAVRGAVGNANPVYSVKWGREFEATEFSKKYTDAHNPQEGFAAILVCSEADASCPIVHGAAVRIPVKYLDPKLFDGAPFESAKYAERRDDIGRFMLSTLLQARRTLTADGKLK
jgi:arsenate reductase (thioredoxin)